MKRCAQARRAPPDGRAAGRGRRQQVLEVQPAFPAPPDRRTRRRASIEDGHDDGVDVLGPARERRLDDVVAQRVRTPSSARPRGLRARCAAGRAGCARSRAPRSGSRRSRRRSRAAHRLLELGPAPGRRLGAGSPRRPGRGTPRPGAARREVRLRRRRGPRADLDVGVLADRVEGVREIVEVDPELDEPRQPRIVATKSPSVKRSQASPRATPSSGSSISRKPGSMPASTGRSRRRRAPKAWIVPTKQRSTRASAVGEPLPAQARPSRRGARPRARSGIAGAAAPRPGS